MTILQLSPHDHKGGASRIAWYLFEGYKKRGIESYLAVGQKSLNDPNILEINHSRYQKIKLFGKARKWVEIMMGLENFNFPDTQYIPDLPPYKPDLIHAHNLQGRYFDLRKLPLISAQFPTLLTLHDNWLLTGHCAYFINCDRWKTGCGKCPDLRRPPTLQRDATAFNWHRKKKIYEQISVNVATPSKWLLDQVENSMLMPSVVKAKVIHNGVNLSVFRPANKKVIRQQLGIPENTFILTYVVASRMKKNSYKDYGTIEKALNLLQDRMAVNKKVVFLGLGEAGETEVSGNLERRFIPYQKDIMEVAKYFQAADVYIHAARADTFPNVILEALACGTPVVATAVGGIPEQVIDGLNGSLVPCFGFERMAEKIVELMDYPEKKMKMSLEAAEDARKRFSLQRMVDDYLDFYSEILADFVTSGSKNHQ